ncbi:MAG: diadenylate cyclase CdaA [Lachnospiraceae bacterium]|nr:diadenylate cyclase CdaA [Lachnospiraceae bacterium]
MEKISAFANKYLTIIHFPTRIVWTDVVEIIIISFLVYQILVWIRDTKAWNLLKGIIVIIIFLLFAAILDLSTILWIANKIFSVAVIAVVIVLQPELRRALEQLGQKSFLAGLMPFDMSKSESGRFSDRTLNELVKASFEMAKVKTGALIVIEQNHILTEYERTGIEIDAVVSSQLLINIFEHNTPLHDGAVLVRGNRVVSATCYLPLSDSTKLSKELGTRHRAGVGISEITDSITIIVSEETGKVSVAYEGKLVRNVDADKLRSMLIAIQNKTSEEEKQRKGWKGRLKRDEKEADK